VFSKVRASRNGETYDALKGPIPEVTSYTVAVSKTVTRDVRADRYLAPLYPEPRFPSYQRQRTEEQHSSEPRHHSEAQSRSIRVSTSRTRTIVATASNMKLLPQAGPHPGHPSRVRAQNDA